MARKRDIAQEQITAAVRTLDGHAHTAQVLQTDLSGDEFHVDLRFLGGVPGLSDGEEVVVAFSGARLAGRPTTRCRFVAGTKGLPRGVARFHVDLCVRGGIASLAERRGADRVRVATGPLVEVRLCGSSVGTRWEGALADISSTGMRVGFAAGRDPGLQPGQQVDVSFSLEGDPEPFEFGAELQYRRPGGGRVAYGFEFERVPSDEYRVLEGRLFGVLIGLACRRSA